MAALAEALSDTVVPRTRSLAGRRGTGWIAEFLHYRLSTKGVNYRSFLHANDRPESELPGRP